MQIDPLRGALAAIILCLAPVCVLAAEDVPESLADREAAALQAAATSVADSVVQIRTIGGLDMLGGPLTADGPTSGLIISTDGYVVSSSFNFSEPPASILVTFASGQQAPAELVATDHSRMIVLLKVHGVEDLPVASTVPMDEIRVGAWAIGLGRTYRADAANVAIGIVSAVDRMYGKVVQTDAATSTANYGGPLVDIHGRVMGLLVPMAPQGASEVAGVQWYDSGIGFAVPMETINERLALLKQGEDQHTGLIGVSFAAESPHMSPAEIMAVWPNAPGGKAGLRKGDRIVEAEGQPIDSITDLRFAIGARYAGDVVRLVVARGEERIEATITLAGELEPFHHAFLGVLPMRSPVEPESDDQAEETVAEETVAEEEEPTGIVVRTTYAGSPAAEAGLTAGDRILEINGTAIDSIADAIREMNAVASGGEVTLEVEREGQSRELTLTAARLPINIPSELPVADSAGEDEAEEDPAAGETRELKLPEFTQTASVYVPAARASRAVPGVVLILHAPGESNPAETIQHWQPLCDEHNLLLVVPTAADPTRWERTELEYLQRLLARVATQFEIDARRVVVYGRGGGGAMAYLLGLGRRDVFRGVATVSAALPRTAQVPENYPSQRLAVWSGVGPGDSTDPRMAQGLRELAEAGYPVTIVSLTASDATLSAVERQQLARWIDSLDRF